MTRINDLHIALPTEISNHKKLPVSQILIYLVLDEALVRSHETHANALASKHLETLQKRKVTKYINQNFTKAGFELD